MPDITMCSGEVGLGEVAGSSDVSVTAKVVCDRRDTCYRYTATPSHWQSWFEAAPLGLDGSCEHYMEDRRTRQEQRVA